MRFASDATACHVPIRELLHYTNTNSLVTPISAQDIVYSTPTAHLRHDALLLQHPRGYHLAGVGCDRAAVTVSAIWQLIMPRSHQCAHARVSESVQV